VRSEKVETKQTVTGFRIWVHGSSKDNMEALRFRLITIAMGLAEDKRHCLRDREVGLGLGFGR
jgi:hypothetical protein